VFEDLNRDGQYQVGTEPPLAGALLRIEETGATFTTGAGGFYYFELSTPQVYRITETDPSGYTSLANSPNTRTVDLNACGRQYVDFGDVRLTCAIADRSFEQGPPPASGWSVVSSATCGVIGNFTGSWGAAHHGVNTAWLGGYCGTPSVPISDSVAQTVVVPTDPSQRVLSFWINSRRQDPDDATPDDWFRVTINNTPIFLRGMRQADNTYPNWLRLTVDLSAYSGQTVALKFLVASAGQYTGNVLLDDISLGGCTVMDGFGLGGDAAPPATPPSPVSQLDAGPVSASSIEP
jgi:hypothetical protein